MAVPILLLFGALGPNGSSGLAAQQGTGEDPVELEMEIPPPSLTALMKPDYYDISFQGRELRLMVRDNEHLFSVRDRESVVIDVERGSGLDRLWHAEFDDDLFVVYTEGICTHGTNYLARLSGEDLRASWVVGLSGFNSANPVAARGALYVSSIGMVGKIDAETGAYVWQHRFSYQEARYNHFEPARIEDDRVVFREVVRGARHTPRDIVVKESTGELLVFETDVEGRWSADDEALAEAQVRCEALQQRVPRMLVGTLPPLTPLRAPPAPAPSRSTP